MAGVLINLVSEYADSGWRPYLNALVIVLLFLIIICFFVFSGENVVRELKNLQDLNAQVASGANDVFTVDGIIVSNVTSSVDVFIQDQTTELIDLYLSELIAEVNITQNTNLDQNWVLIESDTVPVVDNLVCFKEGQAFYQGFILGVTSLGGNDYNISLDTPLDYPYTTVGGCSIREHNLAVDGSVNKRYFSVSPFGLDDGVEWDVVRLMFYIADDSVMDDGLFGGGAALTNGLVVRKKDGIYKNLFNIKSNGEFAQRAYDLRYSEQAKPPSGTLYTAVTRRTFGGQNKNGIVIRLGADNNDELQAIIQDDLTGIEDIHVIVQGHVVD